MSSDDDRFVAFLRQFHPRPPRPLLAARPRRAWLWFGAAAAALLAAIGAAVIISSRPSVSPATSPSSVVDRSVRPFGHTARTIEWDAARLDRLLTDLSPHVLPRVEQPDSVLHVLAK